MSKLLKIFPSDDDVTILEELVEALEIIESGALKIGERDCDLAKADKGSIIYFVTRQSHFLKSDCPLSDF